ncbi:hypothetical protein JVT61DRAFT_11464 [Boletus reticuloceps]|uniref:Uncharacterized protein n=1 Tax=Boletus reticuloceps TaxID=495285 RepID=A0A8I3ABD2_9AGAM|nr:hypothetical protein JVT61DRAFT_11464 [Boletus reticuloceps]
MNTPFFMAGKARSNADAQKTRAPNAIPAPPASWGGMPPNKWHGRGSKAAPGPMSAPAPPPTALSSTSADVSAPDPSVPPPTKKPPTANITWDGRCTDLLVAWITSQAADWRIVFHDRSSLMLTKLAPGDKPSGKNKKEVSRAITKHIFKDEPEHSSAYAADPARYVTSVINQLGM